MYTIQGPTQQCQRHVEQAAVAFTMLLPNFRYTLFGLFCKRALQKSPTKKRYKKAPPKSPTEEYYPTTFLLCRYFWQPNSRCAQTPTCIRVERDKEKAHTQGAESDAYTRTCTHMCRERGNESACARWRERKKERGTL